MLPASLPPKHATGPSKRESFTALANAGISVPCSSPNFMRPRASESRFPFLSFARLMRMRAAGEWRACGALSVEHFERRADGALEWRRHRPKAPTSAHARGGCCCTHDAEARRRSLGGSHRAAAGGAHAAPSATTATVTLPSTSPDMERPRACAASSSENVASRFIARPCASAIAAILYTRVVYRPPPCTRVGTRAVACGVTAQERGGAAGVGVGGRRRSQFTRTQIRPRLMMQTCVYAACCRATRPDVETDDGIYILPITRDRPHSAAPRPHNNNTPV